MTRTGSAAKPSDPAVRLVPPRDAADPGWLAQRLLLWPEDDAAAHLRGMAVALARGDFVRLAASAQGSVLGFAEAALRRDNVNGTTSSPVAFLEGPFVTDGARRQGIARALVDAVAAWAVGAGCRELASDSLLDNTAAHAAHHALGFSETERVVYFLRPLVR